MHNANYLATKHAQAQKDMLKIQIWLFDSNKRAKCQHFIANLSMKSFTNMGRWYMMAITVEYRPEENQAGGFFLSTPATVFFANSSAGVDFDVCEK